MRDLLETFAAAWARKDLDTVTGLFAEDGVYAASVGPEPGWTAHGHAAIRELIAAMFAIDKGATVETSPPEIFGDCAFWTWRYTFPDGQVDLGCDFLRARDGRLVLKDAYRKLRENGES